MLEKNKLFIGNLDGRVRRWHLKEFFAKWWEVSYTKVAFNRDTKRSRGFWFVIFANEEDAAKALEEANGKIITATNKEWEEIVFEEREIRVMYAEAKEEWENNEEAWEEAGE